ncbi:MAG: phosphoethanolamine--lipid A transferase, partial [Xanthomonadales bacterium]|nr:phosphoethanolamine--lipid A transferase [Xanthomonadales bacterium]
MLLWALHTTFLLLLLARWNARWVLGLVFVVSAFATYYMDTYQVFIDPPMVRNVVHTEPKEAAELLTLGLLWRLCWQAGLPLLLLWRVRLQPRRFSAAVGRRALAIAALMALVVGLGLLSFQPMSLLMRGHKEMRYLITPGNWIVSLFSVLHENNQIAQGPRITVAGDAQLRREKLNRPRLLVIFVGETVRAQNWGLSGYQRDTTPELRRREVVNFDKVTACGTSTEVSLPCMFSVQGRRNYDADAIARSDSLLRVLDRAGVATLWRDNQTGCKGVCDGLPFESFLNADDPRHCQNGRCLDEVLLQDLQARVDAVDGSQVIVLHPLGNHGPSYFSRYPDAFERFKPACRTAQLTDCSAEEIVNAYDNAILYTDHLLALTIDFLQQQTDRDTGLIFLSDHGESLGERGLYLHGVPYRIAPDVQTQVPLLLWLSPELQAATGVTRECLQRSRAQPISHDVLFSSVLGLLEVSTQDYDPELDLLAQCRRTTPG